MDSDQVAAGSVSRPGRSSSMRGLRGRVNTRLNQGIPGRSIAVIARCLGAVVLAGALLAAPVASAEDDSAADEYFKLGNEYFNGKLYDKAVEAYEKCVEARPTYKEGWYNLGIAYSKQRKYRKEVDAYKKAVEIDPRYDKALYNLAIAYEDAGQLEDALHTYERVEQVSPDAVDALVNQGILRARLGQIDEAIATYQRAIGKDDSQPDAWFNLGIAFARKAEKADDPAVRTDLLEKERDAYKKTVEIAPRYHKGWYNLAIAHNKLGHLDEEIAAYEEALKARPNYPQALFNLAYAYEEKKDTARAIEAWQRYVASAEKLPTEQEYVVIAKQELQRLRGAN